MKLILVKTLFIIAISVLYRGVNGKVCTKIIGAKITTPAPRPYKMYIDC
jgi:hypothetical protein